MSHVDLSVVLQQLNELRSIDHQLLHEIGHDVASLMTRRTELIQDLLFYRVYGVRVPEIESLIQADANVAALARQIEAEEITSHAVTAFPDRSRTCDGSEDDSSVDGAGSVEGFHYTGRRRRSTGDR